jgi:hypothetical protein
VERVDPASVPGAIARHLDLHYKSRRPGQAVLEKDRRDLSDARTLRLSARREGWLLSRLFAQVTLKLGLRYEAKA